MKKSSFLMIALASALIMGFITGCNTIGGMGRDLGILGSDISSGARAVGHSINGD